MATMATQYDDTSISATSGPTRCSLLDLPGEIRNRIYDFANEDDAVQIFLSRKDGQITRTRGESDEKEWDTMSRQFFGLTQACHAIRAEYLPLYKARTKIHVYYTMLYEYIDTFALPTSLAPSEAVGNIVVHIPKWEIGRAWDDLPLVELLPLINLKKAATKLLVLFDLTASRVLPSNRHSVSRLLNTLMDCSSRPKLQEYLDQAVCRVDLCFEKYMDAQIHLWIKAGLGERWMYECTHYGCTQPTRSDPTKHRVNWAAGLGLNLGRAERYVDFELDEPWLEEIEDGYLE